MLNSQPDESVPETVYHDNPNTLRFEGAGRFDSLAIGTACVVALPDRQIPEQKVEPSQVEGEVARLTSAFESVAKRYEKLRTTNEQTALAAEGNFEGLSMAQSSHTMGNVIELLRDGSWSAAFAIDSYFRGLADAVASMPDRQREVHQLRIDLLDAVEPSGESGLTNFLERVSATPGDIILVAESLSPQELLQLHGSRVRGVILREVGALSHVAVAFPHVLHGVPLITSVKADDFARIRPGDRVIADGRTGFVTINPGDQEADYTKATIAALRDNVHPVSLREHAPKTADGRSFRFTADVISEGDAALVSAMEFGGVGLHRTEMAIIQNRRWLTAEEWFKHFQKLLSAVSPRPVIVRAFDFNNEDKHPPGEDAQRAQASGLKGIRLALNLFRPQLKDMVEGLARASIYVGNRVSLLLPMVIDLHEIRESQKLLKQVYGLISIPGGGEPHPSLISLSAMIETSGAFRLIDRILTRVDSINIGVNDALRSVLDGDRNKSTSAFYHPAFLSELRECIKAAKRAGKPVRICGEMPNLAHYIPLLVGLGAEDLVVAPHAVEKVNAMLRRCRTRDCEQLVDKMIQCGDEQVALKMYEVFIRRLMAQ